MFAATAKGGGPGLRGDNPEEAPSARRPEARCGGGGASAGLEGDRVRPVRDDGGHGPVPAVLGAALLPRLRRPLSQASQEKRARQEGRSVYFFDSKYIFRVANSNF